MTGRPPHRVVVVGGGFGGIEAVKRLARARARVEVTLVDRRNEVTGFDLERRLVELEGGAALAYDTLIVAAGSSYSYFGHDDWRSLAPEVKSLESALDVRARVLRAFEAAELELDAAARRAGLSFAVVGAGPTGVEMAGQIAEIARDTLRGNFRSIDPAKASVTIVEAGDRLLPAFPPPLSAKAARSLERMGVTVILRRTVVGVDAAGLTVRAADGTTEQIAARTVVWAAGVTASPLGAVLAAQSGAGVDGAGRLTVGPDLSLSGRPEVVAIGDMVRVSGADGAITPLPGLAPVAIQQGRYAAGLVLDRLRGRATKPFRYRDKGDLATIGRGRAVADLRSVRLSGPPAWIVWLLVHIWYLIGFQNRLFVMTKWAVSLVTRGRAARLITGEATWRSA